jgi:flagellar basal-body rod protein FlgG
MSNLYFPAVSGMRAQQQRLDLIANNLANLNTPGYKAARAEFAALPPQEVRIARAGATTLGRVEVGSGVVLEGTTRRFTPGALQVTGNVFDVAILGGDAFFQVATPEGVTAYVRSGTFSLDAVGRLTLGDGSVLIPPVVVPAGLRLSHIDEHGVLYGLLAGAQEPEPLGQIVLARFPNPTGLLAAGSGRFVATPAAGNPELGTPASNGWPAIASGMLEASDVDLAEQMVQLIEAQRAYSANARALETLDDMLGLVIRTRS